MKKWKVIRIYRVTAASKKEAIERVHNESENLLTVEFAKEDEGTSILDILKKQVLG